MFYWCIGLQLVTSNLFSIDEGKPIASRRYTDTDLNKRKPADQVRYKTIDNILV